MLSGWYVKCANSLVSLADDGCMTKNNKKSKFPWRYGDNPTFFNGCANPSGSDGGMWCPTAVNPKTLKYEGKWGYCADDCYEYSRY